MKDLENSLVVVQWDEVDDVTNYTVTWTSEAIPIPSATVIEQSSYTITGLARDTIYNITVVASNNHCSGPEYRSSIIFSAGTYHFSYFYCIYIYIYILYVERFAGLNVCSFSPITVFAGIFLRCLG